jgi:hypothetical protein
MNSPIKTKIKTIDGLSIRYAESDSLEKSAILLSPWHERRLATRERHSSESK